MSTWQNVELGIGQVQMSTRLNIEFASRIDDNFTLSSCDDFGAWNDVQFSLASIRTANEKCTLVGDLDLAFARRSLRREKIITVPNVHPALFDKCHIWNCSDVWSIPPQGDGRAWLKNGVVEPKVVPEPVNPI